MRGRFSLWAKLWTPRRRQRWGSSLISSRTSRTGSARRGTSSALCSLPPRSLSSSARTSSFSTGSRAWMRCSTFRCSSRCSRSAGRRRKWRIFRCSPSSRSTTASGCSSTRHATL
eukprot:Amastigsp_a342547_6.p2 type:complete len:115 gc:universal Amastigsp_a342547_6:1275-931(-)